MVSNSLDSLLPHCLFLLSLLYCHFLSSRFLNVALLKAQPSVHLSICMYFLNDLIQPHDFKCHLHPEKSHINIHSMALFSEVLTHWYNCLLKLYMSERSQVSPPKLSLLVFPISVNGTIYTTPLTQDHGLSLVPLFFSHFSSNP